MDLGLADRVVLVTGGTRGLGREIAMQFAREGAAVSICGRSTASLEAAEAALRDVGARTCAVAADLFRAEDCRAVVDSTVEQLGGLDILVNNASTDVGAQPAGLENITDEQLLERVMGKALAAVRCSRAALAHLRASDGGRVVCIGGDSARTTFDPFLVGGGRSNALTAGFGNSILANFVKRLSNEVARDGITVNLIHPSGILSGYRLDARIEKLAARRGSTVDEAADWLYSQIPIGRAVAPADIAPMVAFLASPLAGAITGQALTIDGGVNPAITY